MSNPRNPVPTVDIIILNKTQDKLVLVERANPPYGYALPGGFVDYGETLEEAAVREALEETSLHCKLRCLFQCYSHPSRDTRLHTVSAVYIAHTENESALKGADDAKSANWFSFDCLPQLVFDHEQILNDFKNHYLQGTKTFFLRSDILTQK